MNRELKSLAEVKLNQSLDIYHAKQRALKPSNFSSSSSSSLLAENLEEKKRMGGGKVLTLRQQMKESTLKDIQKGNK